MYQNVEPRAANCTTCGAGPVHPRIVRVKQGVNVVTEAHWHCPRCSSRFMMGTVNVETDEAKKN